jgi:aldose 1-epimerase
MHELVTIRAGAIEAAVAPAAGGRLAQLTVADTPVLIGHSTDAADTGWGCYPMVPWPGRIRRGRFDFDGVEHQLPINFGAHAIHGVGFTSSWSIDTWSADSVTLGLELPSDGSWPFGGAVTQRFEVDDRGLTVSMTVAADRRAMPAAFGWHPWFVKPDSMAFAPTAMYRRDDDHIALDELVDVPTGPWDDCFVNTEPVEITIGPARLRLSSNCDHWVVYDEPGHATCIEPQTAPPDAFNIAPHRLAPGETLSAWFRIDVLAESLPNTTEFV